MFSHSGRLTQRASWNYDKRPNRSLGSIGSKIRDNQMHKNPLSVTKNPKSTKVEKYQCQYLKRK